MHDQHLDSNRHPLFESTCTDIIIFSWYSHINHVRTKNKMDLGNQDMKKNFCKKYYKNILNKAYEEIFDNKLKSIDNNSKLFLFKALKSKNKSEFYLKYPDFEIRRLICKFRLLSVKRDDIRKYLGIYERAINVKLLMTKTISF